MGTKLLNIVLLAGLFLGSALTVDAQKWTRYRSEPYIGGGMTVLLGDLGGASGVANHFLGDINFPAASFAVNAGYRYRFAERFIVRGEIGFSRVSASDSLTTNYDRRKRNLTVRTDIFEFTPLVEFYIVKENVPLRPSISHLFEPSNIFSMYVATGISLIYFNPKGELNGQWYALQPLGTEGQGLKEGTQKYLRWGIAIPFNLGFKFEIPSKYTHKKPTWNITLEFSARWAMTDYLDDVSTEYYDNQAIEAAYGEEAAQLSDKRLGISRYNGRGKRGNPANKDFYGSVQIKIGKHLRGKGRPKNFTRRYNGYNQRNF